MMAKCRVRMAKTSAGWEFRGEFKGFAVLVAEDRIELSTYGL
jgi:hypothetical protein